MKNNEEISIDVVDCTKCPSIEMTQEQKAKAYDKAVKKAIAIIKGENGWGYCDLSEIIPAVLEIFPTLDKSKVES